MQKANDARVAPCPEPCCGGLLEGLANDILGVDEAIGGSICVAIVRELQQSVSEVWRGITGRPVDVVLELFGHWRVV